MEEVKYSEIEQVLEQVHLYGGVDFSKYAKASLKRRIQRFCQEHRISNIDKLLSHLASGDGFITRFVEEITVNTTEMFRDPAYWQILRDDVLPVLAKKGLIRIWHAACSSGEEVYSMGILLKEAGMLNICRNVATDINETALAVARSGEYSLRKQKVNENNYKNFGGKKSLLCYAKARDNRVIFDPELICNVRFQRHDLAKDGPFSKFDLILCRNVMIYFNLDLQERVVGTFSKSMFPGAYLGIGNKESLNWCRTARNLSSISQDEKIYKNSGVRIRL